jgi:hypothetical protein
MISCLVYPVDNYPSGVIAHGQSAPTLNAEVLPNSHDPSSLGRRLTAPNLNREPMRVLMKVRRFRFHQEIVILI